MWTAQFKGDPEGTSQVRRDAERFLHECGIVDEFDAITVMLSELITNAANHGTPPHRLAIVIQPTEIRVSVDDTSGGLPVVMPADPCRVGGNGMRIVSALADRWGVERRPGGKTVWFTVAR